MLKSFCLLLVVIVAFVQCTPTATQYDKDILALLAQLNGGEKTITTGTTMNKVICPTEVLNLETCEETMTKTIVPLEMQMVQNFERIMAVLEMQCGEDMEEEDDDEGESEQDNEDKYKAKLLALIQQMKDEKRELPIPLAPVPTPTKLQCTAANTRLHIVDALLSNVDDKCTALPGQQHHDGDEQKCHETTLAAQLVIQKCENQASCLLSVDHDFARVCPCATQKYLDVTYTCVTVEDDDEDEDDENETTTTTSSTASTSSTTATTTASPMSAKKSRSKRQLIEGGDYLYDYGYGYDYYPSYYIGDDYYGYGYGYDYLPAYGVSYLDDYYGYGYGYDYYLNPVYGVNYGYDYIY